MIEKFLKRNRIPRQQCQYATATLFIWIITIYTLGRYLKFIGYKQGTVPKILHKTTRVLSKDDIQTAFYKECEDIYLSDGWEVKLWYDDMINLFVAEHYPQYFDQFKEITPNIKKVDAIRYLLMYHYGGMYLDMDDECIRAASAFVDGLVKGNTFWMTGYIEPHFMMSTPGNKFALFAFETILRDWKKYNVRSTGGPQGLNRMAKAYVSMHGKNAVRPFVMYDQSECDRIKPSGDVICGEPTHRWVESLDQFPESKLIVTDKIGFIPSNLFDPTACLTRIGECKNTHCHDKSDVKDSLTVHHCLFSWKSEANG